MNAYVPHYELAQAIFVLLGVYLFWKMLSMNPIDETFLTKDYRLSFFRQHFEENPEAEVVGYHLSISTTSLESALAIFNEQKGSPICLFMDGDNLFVTMPGIRAQFTRYTTVCTEKGFISFCFLETNKVLAEFVEQVLDGAHNVEVYSPMVGAPR